MCEWIKTILNVRIFRKTDKNYAVHIKSWKQLCVTMIFAFERGTKRAVLKPVLCRKKKFNLTIQPCYVLNNNRLCRTPPLIKIVYKIKWLICRQTK